MPADTPVTMPVAITLAIVVLLLLQLPPVALSLKVIAAPAHKLIVPVAAGSAGAGFTVSIFVTVQPVPVEPNE